MFKFIINPEMMSFYNNDDSRLTRVRGCFVGLRPPRNDE